MTTNLLGKEQYRTNTQDLEWEEERAEFEDHRENIGDAQRMLSAIAGMIFLASGLSRRNWSSITLVTIGGGLLYRATSGYCPAFGAMGIDMSHRNQSGRSSDTGRLGRRKIHTDRAMKIQRSIEINRPANGLYRFWRSLDNLPRIMNHLDSVQVINDRLSHWVVKAMPGIPQLEWDAEIINDVKNQRIGWRSLKGADVDNAGSVEVPADGWWTAELVDRDAAV